MSNRTFPLPEPLKHYLAQVGLRRHAVLQALEAETQQLRYGKMQTTPEQAQLLQFLVHLLDVRHYLEIGVFTGYSVLAVALAMPEDGKITGCDVSPEFVGIAQRYWEKAGVAHKVKMFLQPAQDTLAALPAQTRFDLIYIDADKAGYPYYYERALELLRPGGVIAMDNMMSGGRVINPQPDEPAGVDIIRHLNVFIHADPRVNMLMLPIGDGLTLVQKKGA